MVINFSVLYYISTIHNFTCSPVLLKSIDSSKQPPLTIAINFHKSVNKKGAMLNHVLCFLDKLVSLKEK